MSKPRTGISGVPGLGKVVNESAWGVAKAEARYGKSDHPFGRATPEPQVQNKPQFRENAQDLPKYDNIVPSDSWLRGGGKNQAEGKVNFDHSKKR